MKSGGQKWKITNIELNKAIDVPNLPRWLDKVDIYVAWYKGNTLIDIYGIMGPFNGEKGQKIVETRGSKMKIH